MLKNVEPSESSLPASIQGEITTLTEACTLTAQPVFDLATRWLATDLGDMAALHLLSEDGMWLQAVASYDRDPSRRAIIEAFNRSVMLSVADSVGLAKVLVGRTDTCHHVKFDDAMRFLPTRFRQHADRLLVQSYISTPVKNEQGLVIGMLTVARFIGERPYPATAVTLVEELAHGVSLAISRVERFSAAWLARDTLFESLEGLFRTQPSLEIAQVSDVVLDLLDQDLAEAVFDPQQQLVAANEEFLSRFGLSLSEPDRLRIGAGIVSVCPAVDVDTLWSRLLSGMSDFLSTDSSRCIVDQPNGLSIHWAVVRRPDGSPAAIVAACESGRSAADRAIESDEAPMPCWGLCPDRAHIRAGG
ncbi:MAG: hypothetical protein Q7V57_10080 [Actinomycetota bacterium]|nr:hypothetical protein [Actinomycetota bacterium]